MFTIFHFVCDLFIVNIEAVYTDNLFKILIKFSSARLKDNREVYRLIDEKRKKGLKRKGGGGV